MVFLIFSSRVGNKKYGDKLFSCMPLRFHTSDSLPTADADGILIIHTINMRHFYMISQSGAKFKLSSLSFYNFGETLYLLLRKGLHHMPAAY